METNPGPKTRSAALLALETLPDDPAEQMNVMFHLLKDLHSRSIQAERSQAVLEDGLKTLQAGQKKIEASMENIQTRLFALEEKTKAFEHIDHEMATLATQHDSLLSRIDELEDRSRRNNLIFYGFSDSPRETWEQSESLVKDVLTNVLPTLSDDAFERAHRLGSFSPSKARPIIVKFSSFKVKDQILSARKKLREKNVTVSEDFCPATREIRNKLTAFAKSQPGEPLFHLRYKRLVINKTHYIYNPATNEISEDVRRSTTTYDQPRLSPRTSQ